MNSFHFEHKLTAHQLDLVPLGLETLQVNITKLCNQACHHCHVDSSPKRREMMSLELITCCLNILEKYPEIQTLDITGGAPELHPEFQKMVRSARQLQKRVIVRHNLTVTLDPHPITKASMEELPDFFAQQQVELICSLPYYKEYFTDRQRGSGVFQKSIESLQRLNRLGYGQPESPLVLNLIYNPVGPYLPPPQKTLEEEYKKELQKTFGISFHQLFVMTNMPIHRFRTDLERKGNYEEYMQRLWDSFNPSAAQGIMCRNMISVSYEGFLYDCDFNQMLDLRLSEISLNHLYESLEHLKKRKIIFREHCLGCTAGAGSSCGGNTT